MSLVAGIVFGRSISRGGSKATFLNKALDEEAREKEVDQLIRWLDGLTDSGLPQAQMDKVELQRQQFKKMLTRLVQTNNTAMTSLVNELTIQLAISSVHDGSGQRGSVSEAFYDQMHSAALDWFRDALRTLDEQKRAITKQKLLDVVMLPVLFDFLALLGDGENPLIEHVKGQDSSLFSRLLYAYFSIYKQLKGYGMILDIEMERIGKPFQFDEDYDEFIFFLSRKSSAHPDCVFDPRWLLKIRWLIEVVKPTKAVPNTGFSKEFISKAEMNIEEWCVHLSEFFSEKTDLSVRFDLGSETNSLVTEVENRKTGRLERDLVELTWWAFVSMELQ